MNPDFDKQQQRLFHITGTTTQTELAALLGVAQSSICAAFARKHIPSAWLLVLFIKAKINPLYLLGTSTMPYLGEVAAVGDKVVPQEQRSTVLADIGNAELLAELKKRLSST